jgi:hypothetical protein
MELTRKRKFGEDGIMNTSPHDMHVISKDGKDLLVYERGPKIVRCEQAEGKQMEELDGCIVQKVTPYTLNANDLDDYKGAKVLLCSTLLANHYKEIKQVLGQDVRILVPDSGITAIRNPDNTLHVKRFFEYCDDDVDEWVEDTLKFIKEKGDDIKKGFIAAHCPSGKADECLNRIKEHGWMFIPDLVYDPKTTHIHLVPLE